MKKRTKRILALILSFAMMMQQTSIGTAAAETETEPVTEAVTETLTETETEPESQAVSENETEKQSEAQTEAVTEPVTEQISEAATEAETPETEIAETEIAETETEEATEIETETETAAEPAPAEEAEAGPTLLSSVCEGVNITVTAAPGVLAPGTVLSVEKVASDAMRAAMENAISEDEEVDSLLAFDISLIADGQEVQPNGQVKVAFNNVPFTMEEDSRLVVAHMPENHGIATVSVFSAGPALEMADGLQITTDSFSVYAVAVLKKLYQKESEKGTPDADNKYTDHKDDADIEGKYQAQNSFKYTDKYGNVFSSPAFDFHIFAEEVEFFQHTNGNIATNNLKAHKQAFGTNQNVSGSIDYKDDTGLHHVTGDGVLEYNYFGESVEDLTGSMNSQRTVLGSGINCDGTDGEIYINGEKKDGVSEVYQEQSTSGEKFLDVTTELNNLKNLSIALAEEDSNVNNDDVIKPGSLDPNQTESNDPTTIDMGDCAEGGIYYMNISAADLLQYTRQSQINIVGVQNRTLIINVDMSELTQTEIEKFAKLEIQVDGLKNGEELVRSNCNLLWNFYQKDTNGKIENFTTEKYSDGYFQIGGGSGFLGSILAPAADIKYGAVNGSIIAHKAKSTGNESHNWRFTGLSASVTVWKVLEGTEGDSSEKTFWFGVFNEDCKRLPDQRPRSVTVKPGERASVTFADLHPGTTYYIYELNSNGEPIMEGGLTADGYQVSGSGAVVILPEQTHAETTIKNSKTKKEDGSLKVMKTVIGTSGDTNEEFTFVVTLGNDSINGTYGEMEFKNGVATFTLKHGESKTATGLPKDIRYTVVESNNAGYTVTKTGDTGTITAGGTQTAAFTNTRDTGNLSVTKAVTGGSADQEKSFNFTVTLDDESINGAYGEMTFTKGVATFTLKHGETKMATGLPTGIKYTVEEAEAGKDNYTTTKVGTTGTISKDETSAASFVNHRGVGELEVSKNVTGDGGDQEKSFNFTVTLDDATINGAYGGMTFEDGVATFTLKDGETKKATNLPVGIKYTVTEAEANQDNYTTTETGTTGTIAENDTKTAEFVNDRGAGNLAVKKTVSGNAGERDREFNFKVTLGDKTISGKYGDMTFEDGVAEFTLKHNETKTAVGLPEGITYKVEETDANQDGYRTVSSGRIEASITKGETETVTFENIKAALAALTVRKKVAGNAGSTTKEFSFEVKLDGNVDDGTYGDMTFTNGVAEFALRDSESMTATDLPVGLPYTVTETDANQNGYITTYSGMTTAGPANGMLESGEIAEVVVTNTKYKISLIKKDKDGKTLLSDAEFDLYRKGDTEPISTGLRTDEKGEVVVDGITPGTYYFVEKKAPEGYVTPDGEYAKSDEITVNEDGTFNPSSASVTKTNQKALEVSFSGKKIVETAEGTPIPNKEFTFELYKADENYVEIGGALETRTVTGSQSFEFETTKKYSAPATDYFVVKEVAGTEAGFDYDDTVYQIKVEVKFENGELTKTVTVNGKTRNSDNADGLDFTNTYSEEGTLTLHVKKTFTKGQENKEFPKEGFTFTLNKGTEGTPGPENDTVTVYDADTTGDFGPITFKDNGTYTYTIQEAIPENKLGGVTYDETVYTVTVTVKNGQEQDGKKSIDVSWTKDNESYKPEDNTAIFANTYEAKETEITFGGTKFLEGIDSTNKRFTFELYETGSDHKVEGAKLLDSISTKGTIQKSQTYSFKKLTYTKADTYYYVVREIAQGAAEGFTYDDTVYEITVTVTDDGKGNLTATSSGASVGALNFTNEYKAEEAEITFSGTKSVEGIESTDQEFTFELFEAEDDTYQVAEDAQSLQSVSTSGTITGSQDYSFGKLTYTEAGTHYYVVKEKAQDTANGFTYDDTVYTVKVTVTDDGKGKLTAEADQAVDAFDFTNKYETTDANITFGGTKFVEGVESTGKEFTFNLYETDETFAVAEDAAPLQSVSTSGTITGSQDYKFAELTYAEAGTYYYVVKENIPAEADGFTYDVTAYEITVTVTDDGMGKLTAEADAADVLGLDFTNTYEAEGTLSLDAVKTMAKPESQLGTFQFEVKDADGNVIAAAANDADGKVLFQDIVKYTAEDIGKTFTYTVSEVIPETADGIVYDDTVYTVTVEVADAGDGALSVTKTVTAGDAAADAIVFTNDTTRVEINKVDEAGNPVAGATLQIQDADGTVIDTWESGTEPHILDGKLNPGAEYTLVETKAPAGFAKADPVKFTVNADGTTTLVTMVDKAISLHVDKVELTTDEEVDGAELTLFDSEGNVVESWTSKKGENHDFGSKLETGKTYTLRETVTPDDYLVATDITFTVEEDGSITTGARSTTDSEGNTVYLMEDARKPESHQGRITVTKSLMMIDGTAIGMDDATFYVALFADAEHTKRVSPVQPITFKGLTTTPAVFTGLGAGTYYVAETDASGNPLPDGVGYYEDVVFLADFAEGDSVVLESDTFAAQLHFNNQFYDFPPGYFYQGELQLTKNVMKHVIKDGSESTEEYVVSDVFYAGIFLDPEYTELFGVVPIVVEGASSSTVVVPLDIGENPEDVVTYYVTETDENGNPLANATELNFVYDVNGSTGEQVQLSSQNMISQVVITNTFTEEEEIESETETETETEKQTETQKPTETEKTKAAQTGDSTNYWIYLMLLLMSAGAVTVVAAEKRRTKKNDR